MTEAQPAGTAKPFSIIRNWQAAIRQWDNSLSDPEVKARKPDRNTLLCLAAFLITVALGFLKPDLAVFMTLLADLFLCLTIYTYVGRRLAGIARFSPLDTANVVELMIGSAVWGAFLAVNFQGAMEMTSSLVMLLQKTHQI